MTTSSDTSKKVAAVLGLVVMSLLLASCGARRDGFDWGRLVLFSAVSGKVLDKGKPVAGLTLTRTVVWAWMDETFTDTTVTDKDGSFSFPVLKKFSVLLQVLPTEPGMRQSIDTVYQGKAYKIWSLSKPDYDNNGELFHVNFFADKNGVRASREVIVDPKKVPITVMCDLATEVRMRPDGGIDWDWFDSRGPKGALGLYCMVD
jgi:hypothetical protein